MHPARARARARRRIVIRPRYRIGARRACKPRSQRRLRGVAAFDLHGREHEDVDAEASIEACELLQQKRQQVLGRAAGKAHAGARFCHRAVGAIERQVHAPRAEPARIEA